MTTRPPLAAHRVAASSSSLPHAVTSQAVPVGTLFPTPLQAASVDSVDAMMAQLASLGTAQSSSQNEHTTEHTRTTTVKYSARDMAGRPTLEHTVADMAVVRDGMGNIVEATVERSATDRISRPPPRTPVISPAPRPIEPRTACCFPSKCASHGCRHGGPASTSGPITLWSTNRTTGCIPCLVCRC